jgi:superfamily II DNA helicase RecQ
VALDSFWNLGARLKLAGIVPKIIGLTATMRTDDVMDIMGRLGTPNMLVSRASCHRPGLTFEFKIPQTLDLSMLDAVQLATTFQASGKVIIFTTAIETCEKLGAMLQQSGYKGWV